MDLGVALQLTNILRDVPGDFERGRVYIPLEDWRVSGAAKTTSPPRCRSEPLAEPRRGCARRR